VTGLTRPTRFEVGLVVVVVVVDQLTKSLVRGRLALYDSVTVIPGWLDLTRVHNTGVAFGMMNGTDFPLKSIVVPSLAVLAMLGVLWFALTIPATDRFARWGMAGVVGGAIGNLIDRATTGYVLDFVDAYRGDWHFWAFNVADAAISIGVVCLLLDVLGVGRRASHPV
jgi:signal peptidase II